MKNKFKFIHTIKICHDLFIISIFIFPFCILYILFIYKFFPKIRIKISKNIKDNDSNVIIDEETYIRKIYNYMRLNINGQLINNSQKFKKFKNPKISIVITVHNGEGFLKTALRSVQNQDFHEIEIIIIDDASEDGSLKLIKELMKEDPRIVLIENHQNRGALYTKTKGVLYAKGKYVMILDVDDLYSIEFAFTYLYKEAEKNNLDILGFSAIQGEINCNNEFQKRNFHNFFETNIIIQPKLNEQSYIQNKKGEIIGVRDVLWCYFYKTDLFKKVINEIEDKFLNRINNGKDDIFVYFLLVNRARKLKHIKKIFYITVQKVNLKNPLMIYFNTKKYNIRNVYGCWENISYIELVLKKSRDNFKDKKIASFSIKYFLLNNSCRKNLLIRKEALEVCKLYLENEYIEREVKEQISAFLIEVNTNYSNLKGFIGGNTSSFF